MNKIFAITIQNGNYEQVIYVKSETITVKELGKYDELEQAEKDMFGYYGIFNPDVAIFEAEAIR
jgi:hypothetical protein